MLVTSCSSSNSSSFSNESNPVNKELPNNNDPLNDSIFDTHFIKGSDEEVKRVTQQQSWQYPESYNYIHPYELLNIHKVHAFSDPNNSDIKLTGKGQVVQIVDDGDCELSHDIYKDKTLIDEYYSNKQGRNHCLAVTNVLAGSVKAEIMGVAPDADVFLSTFSGNMISRKASFEKAKEYGVIVSNNSWGRINSKTELMISADDMKKLIADNPGYKDIILSWGYNDVEGWNSYIDAMNSFQEQGIIVFANGNDEVDNNGNHYDSSYMASLPYFYEELEEAWLSVTFAELEHTENEDGEFEKTWRVVGNKCGTAKPYCLTVDSYGVYAAGKNEEEDIYRYTAGSSVGAPMVSGGVALLFQAFPNHTPGEIRDRILASANNDFFVSVDGFSDFGKGIKHYYNEIYGHGIPDFYAALKPIVSDELPLMIYMGDSTKDNSSATFKSSYIESSSLFGDTIKKGLSDNVNYAYDALDAGFSYNVGNRVVTNNDNNNDIKLALELSKLNYSLDDKEIYSQDNKLLEIALNNNLDAVITSGDSIATENFFSVNNNFDINSYKASYLKSDEDSIGLAAVYNLDNAKITIAANKPNAVNKDMNVKESFITSVEYNSINDASMTFMTGVSKDSDNLLGTTGGGVYSLAGADTNTKFAAIKAEKKFPKDFSITAISTMANTRMSKPDNSLIESANDVKSNSIFLIANKDKVIGNDDNATFFIGHPSRVNDGNMQIKQSHLANSDGSLEYKQVNVDLYSNIRQLDYGFSYRKDINNDLSLSIRHTISNNLNHIEDEKFNSSFFGLKHDDLMFGIVANIGENSNSKEIYYSYNY